MEAQDPVDRVHHRANDRRNSSDQQKKSQSSEYFTHAEHAVHHVEKMKQNHGEVHTNPTVIAGDLHVAPGLGVGTEQASGGPCTFEESNRRRDWLNNE